MNGVKFVKLNSNNQFVAVAPSICPHFATGMYMQDFTSGMCASAPTPSGTDYFPIGVLTDRRDNKSYEVRKFADGNCWMVDNLAYGGADLRSDGLDGCLKTTFCGMGYTSSDTCITNNANATSTVDKIAPGLYGDCRYPYTNTAAADVNKYGYLYSWQAAVQDAQAYYGNDYQPSQPTQGICPEGWYIPTGGLNGQFQALHVAAGSPQTGFWQAGASWNGVFSGHASYNSINFQNSNGAYLSSGQSSSDKSYTLNFRRGDTRISHEDDKFHGLAVRCLKTP